MNRWPTEPVAPRTPVQLLAVGSQLQLGEQDKPHFFLGKAVLWCVKSLSASADIFVMEGECE